MTRIQDILDKVSAYNPEADLALIERAYVYSARVHEGQVRLSGEPYLNHPLEVAAILAGIRLDCESIAVGLLHDVVEETHASLEEIEKDFGPDIRELVSGVTRISNLSFKTSRQAQAENIRKMILAMADDIRVILIKLADRLHNMRTVEFHEKDRQMAIASETLDIYAPIASRLGIYSIKQELEDLAFMVMQPEKYQSIEKNIAMKKEERDGYVSQVLEVLQKKLSEAQIQGDIKGRHKHLYSIWSKMQRQNLDFEDVYDIIAFRIVVDTVPQCYEILGIVHSLWKPIAKKIKDYISNPKPNMYQSLHTTVMGPFRERMEVQIRTREMDQIAEWGIAAHWSYKEGKTACKKTRDDFAKTFSWIQNFVEHQKNVHDPNEFLENVRIELFPEEVYVFTPQGEVIALPRGATPLDFAYAIHTEVGNRCVGAKVNGRMVPLRTEVSTGDVLEILTAKNHHPSKDWLRFVKTAKARTRIRQWIKTQEREKSLALGREVCEKTLRRHKLALSTLLKSPYLKDILDNYGYKDADDMLAAVGYGKLTPLQIFRKYESLAAKDRVEEEPEEELPEVQAAPMPHKVDKGVTVRGLDDILIRFAQCCNPVPGDSITGYITRGYGVTVHQAACVNVRRAEPHRLIEVAWGAEENQTFPVRLHVLSQDRVGLLADITAAFSQANANIINSNSRQVEADGRAEAFFTVSVSGKEALERVMATLLKVPGVHDVRRITG